MNKENESCPFDQLARPAQRALANAGINTLEQLADLTETEFVLLHGIGKNALQIILQAMAKNDLSFTPEVPLFV